MRTTNKNLNGKSDKWPDPVTTLPEDLVTKMYRIMVQSRVLEERLIKLYRTGDSFFWIGAPGEEAFGVPLGMLANVGTGPEHDYFHLHYRGTPTLLAIGMPMIESIRLMLNKATDSSTGGRNFSNHYCFPEFNVVPVSSPIEVQYSMALGTARVQQRRKTKGITIVTGGDAGSAEGDFASSLIWSTRTGNELPMLITVQNNKWGISTDYSSQHGEEYVSDRGRAFRMRTENFNGNDPVESYIVLKRAMEYVRDERKPYLVEARVSRLYGHSSASGANRIPGEDCCLELFESRLIKNNYFTESECRKIWKDYEQECLDLANDVRKEPEPTVDLIWKDFYANGENGDWRKF